MDRRLFLGAVAGAAYAHSSEGFDLMIQNGTVCDPARNFKRRADVGIRGDRIAAIEDRLDAKRSREVVDATGLYVTPGLVDLHTHCYWLGTGLGLPADPVAARSGVTTWVDAGSFGCTQAEGFRKFIVEPSTVRIFGFVYLYPDNRNPDADPIKYVRSFMRRTGATVTANKDILLGVKLQVGSNMNGRYSYDFLKIARELCDSYKIPLMAHISFAPPETDQVMELMRPGDIVTHCYNRHTLGILDNNGKVKQSVRDARARGVLFDVGHGLGSFNFEAAQKALADGFVADTVSTDIYNLNEKGPVFDLPTTMSKMIHLGMSFDDVLMRTTIAPARIIARVEGLGTLAPGAPADVALLKIEEGEFPLVDSQKNTVTAKQRVRSTLTICRGKRLA
ncbi:MAG TPA: amidohydrolase/deacetylase family metallohydrolase [Bryobacteraceae bacterium]|nr:amidohydrolase/deacetylase family metallohydrolase [Bryobacteraceae bacterium]